VGLILPFTLLSAVVAAYLAWQAFPLVREVAALGRPQVPGARPLVPYLR
jgi:hypothetical protein